MISDRVYRRGRSYEEAAAELDAFSGRQFDPEVVAAFHRVPRAEWDDIRRRSLEEGDVQAATRRFERAAAGIFVRPGAMVN
jgi:HD-GYP domain-containing protein (c-di-GMP phosphodiesterase class II)